MQLGEIGEQLRRATVQVRLANQQGAGSGVLTSSTGYMLTNAHVVQGRHPEVELWDGRRFPGRLLALGRKHDLALVKIDTLGLPAIEFGDSNSLKPGSLVIAVGNPLGFSGALSMGVVHTLGTLRGLGENRWVQADVRLAPGNSGGPLADAQGRLMGINTMIARGLSLAIPSNVAAEFLARATQRSKAA
jgi:serine protease Do